MVNTIVTMGFNIMRCDGRYKIILESFNFKYWEVANNGQDGLTRLSCNLTRWTDRYSIPRLLPKGYIFIFRIDLSLEKTARDKVDHQRIIFFYIKMTEAQISIKSLLVTETSQKICGQKVSKAPNFYSIIVSFIVSQKDSYESFCDTHNL